VPKIRLERARIVAVVGELVKMFLPEGVCMASMKKEDARRAILSEYDRWAKKHPNDATMMGGFLFFRYLQNERTNLLDFRASDNDKWQIVHGWLLGERLTPTSSALRRHYRPPLLPTL
jgi:hypothetical protein